MSVTTFSSPDLQAYFQSKRSGLDAQLVAHIREFIAATESTLDCAIYDLRHPDVLAALVQLAERPHVRLRIAFDASGEHSGGLSGDPKPDGTEKALDRVNLRRFATPVHEHGRHLMHDKFMVRDGKAVWVGSANMTEGGLELQDNNCLAINSSGLATTYTTIFEDLLRPDHEHSAGNGGSAPPAVSVGGAHIAPYFAPQAGEGIEKTLVEAINQARRIRILAFLIGDEGILTALAPFASNHAFDIRGIYDPHGMQDVLRFAHPHSHTGYDAHAAAGDQRFWFLRDPRFVAAPSHGFSPGREQDFMHNKVIVIDDRLVFTGSYNFSENAEANDETLLAIDSPTLAAAYTAYFDAMNAVYAHGATSEPAAAAVSAVATGAAVHATTSHAEHAHAEHAHAEHAHAEHAHAEHAHAEHAHAEHAHAEHAHAEHGRRNRAEVAPHERPAARRAPRRRTALDHAITVVLVFVALIALALVVFGVLVSQGVIFR